MSDYYEILGLSRNATEDDIKKAYRTLAKEHHPDKNGGDHSEKFIEIQMAYDVLSDIEERAMYDEYGFSRKDADLEIMQSMVTQIINNCLGDGLPPEHLIDEIEGTIEDEIEEFKQQLIACEKVIVILRKQKEAVKTKEGIKYDIVGNGITGLIKQAESDTFIRNRDITLREKLLGLIKYYEKFGGMPEPVEAAPETVRLGGFRYNKW